MKRRFFNMIEVTLAMAVLSVCATSMLTFLPILSKKAQVQQDYVYVKNASESIKTLCFTTLITQNNSISEPLDLYNCNLKKSDFRGDYLLQCGCRGDKNFIIKEHITAENSFLICFQSKLRNKYLEDFSCFATVNIDKVTDELSVVISWPAVKLATSRNYKEFRHVLP